MNPKSGRQTTCGRRIFAITVGLLRANLALPSICPGIHLLKCLPIKQELEEF
jgi:hypothetical protein